MARARLHIICGNCGCNDEFTFHIDPKGNDYGDRFEPSVVIVCHNCSTLHSLDTTINEKPNPHRGE